MYTIGGVLYHHGIQGQKWGKRNGPPYPLSPGDHSAAEKEAAKSGRKSSSSDNTSKVKKPKQGIIPITPGTVKLALLTVSVASMAATGAAKVGKSIYGKIKQKQFDKEKANAKVDKKTGLKLKSREMSDIEDLKRVNNSYNKLINKGSTKNCVRCTASYELRRRGYEVSAAKASNGTDGAQFMKDLFGAKDPKGVPGYDKYPPLVVKEITAEKGANFSAIKATREALSKEPKGSRGQMIVQWSAHSGHSYIYQITDKGKVEFLDAQNGKKLSTSEGNKYLRHSCAVSYQRLDNCETINKSMLKEVVDDYSDASKKKSGK